MMKNTIILSSSGLKNLVIRNQDQESQFIFKIGNKNIRMHQLYAEFISPTVSHIHQCDPTINSISIDCPQNDEFFTDEIISQIQRLSSSYSIEIEQKDSPLFRNLSLFLGNEELHHAIDELFPIDFSKSTTEELINELKNYEKFNKNVNSTFYSSIVQFIAGKFETINKQELKKVSKSILYSILTSDKLKIENEDELKDFIDDIFSNSDDENNEDIIYFYETLDFTKLSLQKISEILETINKQEL